MPLLFKAPKGPCVRAPPLELMGLVHGVHGVHGGVPPPRVLSHARKGTELGGLARLTPQTDDVGVLEPGGRPMVARGESANPG